MDEAGRLTMTPNSPAVCLWHFAAMSPRTGLVSVYAHGCNSVTVWTVSHMTPYLATTGRRCCRIFYADLSSGRRHNRSPADARPWSGAGGCWLYSSPMAQWDIRWMIPPSHAYPPRPLPHLPLGYAMVTPRLLASIAIACKNKSD